MPTGVEAQKWTLVAAFGRYAGAAVPVSCFPSPLEPIIRITQFIAIALAWLTAGAFAGNPETGMERYWAHDFLLQHGLFRNAAVQGKADAQAILHAMQPNGQAPAEDTAQAAALACNAAPQEPATAQAQLTLAICYENGSGVAKDVPAAMALYEKAAAQGLRDAQRIVGIRYVSGADGAAHDEMGMAWLRRAAGQGDAFAKTLLDLYAGKFESPAIEALRMCHQQSVAALDDGVAATDTLTAAVQTRCAAALDAWIQAHFPEASRHGLQYLREGAHEAERSDVAAIVAAFRSARQRAR